VGLITYDILLQLPTFTAGSARTNKLNSIILTRLSALRDEEVLQREQDYSALLGIATDLAVTRRVVDPCHLLKFAEQHLHSLLSLKNSTSELRRVASTTSLQALTACEEKENSSEESKNAIKSVVSVNNAVVAITVSILIINPQYLLTNVNCRGSSTLMYSNLKPFNTSTNSYPS
jgi:hypothetical protein